MANRKQQQELRGGADEKGKGKPRDLTTNPTGNHQQPAFHEQITTELFSWSRNCRWGCHSPPCKWGFQMTSTLHVDKALHNPSTAWTCRSCQQLRQLPRSAWKSYTCLPHWQESKCPGLAPGANFNMSESTGATSHADQDCWGAQCGSDKALMTSVTPSISSGMQAMLQPAFTSNTQSQAQGSCLNRGTQALLLHCAEQGQEKQRGQGHETQIQPVGLRLCSVLLQWHWESCTAAACPSSPGSVGSSPGSCKNAENPV